MLNIGEYIFENYISWKFVELKIYSTIIIRIRESSRHENSYENLFLDNDKR